MNKFQAALSCADEAVVLQEQIGNSRRALTLLRRAEIRYALGDVPGALFDAEAAHRVADAVNDLDLVSSARLLPALYLARMGEVSEEYVQALLVEVENAPVTRGPLTNRLMEECLAWLAARKKRS
jgi:hypothetical protein